MDGQYQTLLLVIGRLLLGGFFVAAGIQHFFIVPVVSQAMTQRGVPAPRFVLLLGTVFQIAAGSLLIAGILVPAAAIGLVIFTVAASVMLLNFWDMDGAPRAAAVNGWKSNIAIVGGLLVAAAQSI
jgi:putative oxidoreductase